MSGTGAEAVERARELYAGSQWASAFEAFSRAQSGTDLAIDDMERLAWSAALTGHDRETIAALEAVFSRCADGIDCGRAARAAFWCAMRLFVLGEPARASGWLSRAKKAADQDGPDCPVHGYV